MEPKSLGERVASARAKRGLSQKEVAKRAHVSQGTIGNLEGGIRQQPRALLSIAKALQVYPTWLETGKGPWDASGEPQNMFETLSPEERELLDNVRALMDPDREELTREIEVRANNARAYLRKALQEMGLPGKPTPITTIAPRDVPDSFKNALKQSRSTRPGRKENKKE